MPKAPMGFEPGQMTVPAQEYAREVRRLARLACTRRNNAGQCGTCVHCRCALMVAEGEI